VVPLAPGDAADIAARVLGEELSRLLKTPVLLINRPGAGGAVGTHSVVQARKDGQTILFAQNSALTFHAVLDPQSVTYEALRDLVPLGTASRTPTILVVRSDAPYKTFAELIEYSKHKPGQVALRCSVPLDAANRARCRGAGSSGAAPRREARSLCGARVAMDIAILPGTLAWQSTPESSTGCCVDSPRPRSMDRPGKQGWRR
jgi:hypothetical protein